MLNYNISPSPPNPEVRWADQLRAAHLLSTADHRRQKRVNSVWFPRLKSLVEKPKVFAALAVASTIGFIALFNVSIIGAGVAGMWMGVCAGWLRGRLEGVVFQWEEDFKSCPTHIEQNQVKDETVALLNEVGSRAKDETFKNALQDTIEELKDPSLPPLVWKRVRRALQIIDQEQKELQMGKAHSAQRVNILNNLEKTLKNTDGTVDVQTTATPTSTEPLRSQITL